MKPSAPRPTARARATGTSRRNAPPRFLTMLFWMVGLWLLLLASNRYFFVSDWPLLDTPDHSLLGAGNLWNPPVARLLEGSGFSVAPFWLCAMVVAVILADGARRAYLAGMPWQLLLVVLIGLVNIDTRSTIATIACLWLASWLAQRVKRDGSQQHYTWRCMQLAIGVFLLALATTLEVGLVVCVLTLQVVAPAIRCLQKDVQQRPYAAAAACGWILLVALPGFFIDGYVALMLRFVNWLWLRPPIELLPSMSACGKPMHLAGRTCSSCFCWPTLGSAGLTGSLDAASLLLLCLLTIMGLGCTRYYWIAMLTLLLVCIQQPTAGSAQAHSWPADSYRGVFPSRALRC